MKDKAPDIDNMIQDGLANIAGQVNRAPKKLAERSQFASLGHQAIDAMMKSAEEVVKKAQQELETIRERAAQMRKEFDERDVEIAEMMARVTDFGNAQLSAHAKFNGEKS